MSVTDPEEARINFTISAKEAHLFPFTPVITSPAIIGTVHCVAGLITFAGISLSLSTNARPSFDLPRSNPMPISPLTIVVVRIRGLAEDKAAMDADGLAAADTGLLVDDGTFGSVEVELADAVLPPKACPFLAGIASSEYIAEPGCVYLVVEGFRSDPALEHPNLLDGSGGGPVEENRDTSVPSVSKPANFLSEASCMR